MQCFFALFLAFSNIIEAKPVSQSSNDLSLEEPSAVEETEVLISLNDPIISDNTGCGLGFDDNVGDGQGVKLHRRSSGACWSPKMTEPNVLNTSPRRTEGKTRKTETHSPRNRLDGTPQPTSSERCQGMKYIVHVSCAGPEVTGSDVVVSSGALRPSEARNRYPIIPYVMDCVYGKSHITRLDRMMTE